jgi:hypothetical protein
MGEKQCPSCKKIIGEGAKVCPFCRKKFGLTWPAKLFLGLIILGITGALITTSKEHHSGQSTVKVKDTQKEQIGHGVNPFGQDLGSNVESQDFVKSMTELAKALGSNLVWQLELSPKEMKGDIVSYRKSVKYCKATITMDDKWFKETNFQQEHFIRTMLNTLHNPAPFSSKTLDYYPNSSGELSIVVGGKVVAEGTYTKDKTEVSLNPGTYKKETVSVKGKYKAKIKVLNKNGRIQFRGTTNLPNSESILLSLRKKNYDAQAEVKVQNGTFLSEPFSDMGKPLSPGSYSLHLNIYNSKTTLMLEARVIVVLPQTETLDVDFNPTKF